MWLFPECRLTVCYRKVAYEILRAYLFPVYSGGVLTPQTSRHWQLLPCLQSLSVATLQCNNIANNAESYYDRQ